MFFTRLSGFRVMYRIILTRFFSDRVCVKRVQVGQIHSFFGLQINSVRRSPWEVPSNCDKRDQSHGNLYDKYYSLWEKQ